MFKVGDSVKYIGRYWADYLIKDSIYEVEAILGQEIRVKNCKWPAHYSSFSLVKEPKVHATLIKAWADGAKIQYFNIATKTWEDVNNPMWADSTSYRAKLDPKPNQITEYHYSVNTKHEKVSFILSCELDSETERLVTCKIADIKIV